MVSATLLLAATIPMVVTLPAQPPRRVITVDASRLNVLSCKAGTRPGCHVRTASDYRLPFVSDDGPTSKDRAMAETGKRCGLMGEPVCPSRPMTILRSGQDPMDTIASGIGGSSATTD